MPVSSKRYYMTTFKDHSKYARKEVGKITNVHSGYLETMLFNSWCSVKLFIICTKIIPLKKLLT